MCCVPGKKLSDLERVTSLKVYNWFANRRKEIKRRANIGNVQYYYLSSVNIRRKKKCTTLCTKFHSLVVTQEPLSFNVCLSQ